MISGLRRLGHDPAPLLASVGISPATLDDPDARVPMSAGVGLFVRAAVMTGDDCIGLHLEEHSDLRTVDVHFYAMLASATLKDAYERPCRYQRLIHETARVELLPGHDGATLRHVLPGGLAVPRHTAEFVVAAWVRTGRLATDTDWSPAEVRFAHPPPADVWEHARFFRAPVRFSTGENALSLPQSVLALPCVGADPVLASLVDRHVEERTRVSPSASTIADRARSALQALLRDGEPTAAAVASRMKMSVRTLNRTLAVEGTSYRALLGQLRRELAARHLADPRTSIGEVTFLLASRN